MEIQHLLEPITRRKVYFGFCYNDRLVPCLFFHSMLFNSHDKFCLPGNIFYDKTLFKLESVEKSRYILYNIPEERLSNGVQKMSELKKKIKERKERSTNEKRAILKAKANDRQVSDLEQAKKYAEHIDHSISTASIIGPILLALIYLFFPIDFSAFKWGALVIDVMATIVLIAMLCALIYKQHIAQCVVLAIETDKEENHKKYISLKKEVATLRQDQSFYVTATRMIGQAMREGKKDIEELSKSMVSVIYTDVSMMTKNYVDIIINLYELRNNTVKMILSYTYGDRNNNSGENAPFLYRHRDGVSIRDENISKYYCIKCMTGEIEGKDGKFVLPDWKSIAVVFKWNRWNAKQKNEILEKKDRTRCIEFGFKYNQYVAFETRRDDGTKVFLEIVTTDNTVLASDDEIDRVAHHLRGKYTPVINVLWDLSNASPRKGENNGKSKKSSNQG